MQDATLSISNIRYSYVKQIERYVLLCLVAHQFMMRYVRQILISKLQVSFLLEDSNKLNLLFFFTSKQI